MERDNHKLENERRVDHLTDLVEKHTRTERHLEQYSNVSAPENIQHARKIQQERENEIQNLKNIIVHGENSGNDHLENTKKRYQYAEGYLNHNSDHMDSETVSNTKEKQEHRKEQIDFLQ